MRYIKCLEKFIYMFNVKFITNRLYHHGEFLNLQFVRFICIKHIIKLNKMIKLLINLNHEVL